ncbi:hypothetical protein GAY29_00975 [Azospirillum brasilense]|nr:hypothetical protein [Azospirillum brasilense]MBK3731692.1 hypothetical protein [Azospirillum brasilense]
MVARCEVGGPDCSDADPADGPARRQRHAPDLTAVRFPDDGQRQSLEMFKMYDWFPMVFFPFKIIVLGTGMFFAIKWHHDQAKKEKAKKNDEASGL